MSEDHKQNVNTSSTAFTDGVEAGLNSPVNTKNWQAGNQLGKELKAEGENTAPASESTVQDVSTPLFLRNASSSNQGNAQDEKDETEE